MSSPTLVFMIVPYEDVTDEMLEQCAESRETLRHSVTSPDKVLLKYDSATADASIFTGIAKYSVYDIWEILSTDDWGDSES